MSAFGGYAFRNPPDGTASARELPSWQSGDAEGRKCQLFTMFMPIQLTELNEGKVLEVYVSGKLAHEDYQHFVPEFERLVKKNGKIRVLFEMADFHGWDGSAIWDDIKFDLKHFTDIERLAMVGEKKWEKGMSMFCKPFTTAKIRYFDRACYEEARAWLEQD
jgi:hypothetical protein